MEQQMGPSNPSPIPLETGSPEPATNSATANPTVRKEGGSLVHFRPKDTEGADAKGILAGDLVNNPNMEIETNLLLERQLVSSNFGVSREPPAMGSLMQPKNDSLLQLASIDSPEMLDSASAQPLLITNQPEGSRHCVEPSINLIPAMENISSTPQPGYVAPIDEFPPLVKGHTKMLCNSFEKRTLTPKAASVWSGKKKTGEGKQDTAGPVNPKVNEEIGSNSNPANPN